MFSWNGCWDAPFYSCPRMALNVCIRKVKVSLTKMSFLKTIFPELFSSPFLISRASNRQEKNEGLKSKCKLVSCQWQVCHIHCISQGLILQVDLLLLKTSFIFSFRCYLSGEYFSTALMLAQGRLPCAMLQASALHLSQYICTFWVFNFSHVLNEFFLVWKLCVCMNMHFHRMA